MVWLTALLNQIRGCMEFFNITDARYTDTLKTAVGCMVSLGRADAEL